MPRHPPCALTHLTTTRCSHPLCNTQHTTTPQPTDTTTPNNQCVRRRSQERPEKTPQPTVAFSGPNSVPSHAPNHHGPAVFHPATPTIDHHHSGADITRRNQRKGDSTPRPRTGRRPEHTPSTRWAP